MSCCQEKQLALYESGDLSERERATVAEHLALCGECRAVLEDLQFSRELWANCSAEPESEDLRSVRKAVGQRLLVRRRRRRWLQVGALAAGLGIAAVPILFRQKAVEHAPVVAMALPPAMELRVPPVVATAAPTVARVKHARRVRRVAAGLREVVLNNNAAGKPELKIATADPNVVILFTMDEHTHAN